MIARLFVPLFSIFLSAIANACELPGASGPRAPSRGEELRSVVLSRLDGSSAPLSELVPGLARGEIVVLA